MVCCATRDPERTRVQGIDDGAGFPPSTDPKHQTLETQNSMSSAWICNPRVHEGIRDMFRHGSHVSNCQYWAH